MFEASYELRDEPPDLKKCAICGEKAEGGCIPLGSLCRRHLKEWDDIVLRTLRNNKKN